VAQVPSIDRFIDLWTREVEPAYYKILNAGAETQARVATAAFLEQLTKVDEQLWQARMRDG